MNCNLRAVNCNCISESRPYTPHRARDGVGLRAMYTIRSGSCARSVVPEVLGPLRTVKTASSLCGFLHDRRGSSRFKPSSLLHCLVFSVSITHTHAAPFKLCMGNGAHSSPWGEGATSSSGAPFHSLVTSSPRLLQQRHYGELVVCGYVGEFIQTCCLGADCDTVTLSETATGEDAVPGTNHTELTSQSPSTTSPVAITSSSLASVGRASSISWAAPGASSTGVPATASSDPASRDTSLPLSLSGVSVAKITSHVSPTLGVVTTTSTSVLSVSGSVQSTSSAHRSSTISAVPASPRKGLPLAVTVAITAVCVSVFALCLFWAWHLMTKRRSRQRRQAENATARAFVSGIAMPDSGRGMLTRKGASFDDAGSNDRLTSADSNPDMGSLSVQVAQADSPAVPNLPLVHGPSADAKGGIPDAPVQHTPPADTSGTAQNSDIDYNPPAASPARFHHSAQRGVLPSRSSAPMDRTAAHAADDESRLPPPAYSRRVRGGDTIMFTSPTSQPNMHAVTGNAPVRASPCEDEGSFVSAPSTLPPSYCTRPSVPDLLQYSVPS
ncbi:hypothetical protein L226DRAFT_387102 [Lentinus tigrinus ALCF2SS1-7]|uniref:Uncharacterized protein n=1 Tax=Lentinus tigrinus ALCF2SS1-6 TaxID=1328759 RepID=A0A5C2SBI4_9APHY|nr:hypothetical protein L227DRAFT_88610 [Lentinus tigrinus ALCF2SS1-6]RPD75757.1 hypothetical protein L226DRAFT_387102 [Lentinus tigrinus ALCF2SS1-7]